MVVADLIEEYSERYNKVQRNDNVRVDFANDCLRRGITEKIWLMPMVNILRTKIKERASYGENDKK